MEGSPPESNADVTWLLEQAHRGDEAAIERLMPLVYDELRTLAASYLKRERIGHTLQATALVNEAYLKMIDQARVDWNSRDHFRAFAANAMRQILVDHARGKNRKKRATPGERIALSGVTTDEHPIDLIMLDDALHNLNSLDPRKVRVVEMRYFGGMTVAEIAETLDIAPATVKRDWDFARRWLLREMGSE